MGRKKRKAVSPLSSGAPPPPPPPPPNGFGNAEDSTTFLIRKYKFDATEFRNIQRFVDYVKNQRWVNIVKLNV